MLGADMIKQDSGYRRRMHVLSITDSDYVTISSSGVKKSFMNGWELHSWNFQLYQSLYSSKTKSKKVKLNV